MLLEVNGESVRNTSHTDLVTMLKRCPKGNQTNFLVLAGTYVCMSVRTQMYTLLVCAMPPAPSQVGGSSMLAPHPALPPNHLQVLSHKFQMSKML